MLQKQKDITLVDSVVTIVVLIILATISIAVTVNGGIVGKAQESKNIYEEQGEVFNKFTANTVSYIDSYLNAAKNQLKP